MYLHVTSEWLQEICIPEEGGVGGVGGGVQSEKPAAAGAVAMVPSSYPAQISEILALTLENEVD